VWGKREGKPEEKIPLIRPRHRWKHNIKTDLHETGCGLYRIVLSQGGGSWKPVVNAVIKLRFS
jgi:hypothetical protein